MSPNYSGSHAFSEPFLFGTPSWCTRYTLVAHNFVTDTLLNLLFSSIQLACVVWGICTSSSFYVLCILHALCYVFHRSSLSSFKDSFAPSLSHIPVMSYFHCFEFNHSAVPVSICTTIQQQQQQFQPANLSIFPSCMFLCRSFSYGIPSSLHTLYHHLLSHLILCFLHRSQITFNHCPLSSFPLPLHLLGLRDLGQIRGLGWYSQFKKKNTQQLSQSFSIFCIRLQ